jgi:hypothetical protein
MNNTGQWQPVQLCSTCGYELSRFHIFDNKLCPHCAATATFCLDTLRTAKRWVVDFKPTFWQRCTGKKTLGHWEWSGKAEKAADTAALAKFMPGRHVAGGMNTVTIAAAGIASGLF